MCERTYCFSLKIVKRKGAGNRLQPLKTIDAGPSMVHDTRVGAVGPKKKPRPFSEAGFTVRSYTRLFAFALGCFKWIDFSFSGLAGGCHVCGHVAVSHLPFHGRIRVRRTVPAAIILDRSIAAVALLNDLMANPTVVGTPFGSHKRAFLTFTNRCTNHWNHPPFFYLNPSFTKKNRPYRHGRH